ncbi:phosphatase PAP2 family protein [Saccharothrix sp. AJ9571]|nr:phosphatase PAP2 family protein [Saccharothrix sp. AJ9571]
MVTDRARGGDRITRRLGGIDRTATLRTTATLGTALAGFAVFLVLGLLFAGDRGFASPDAEIATAVEKTLGGNEFLLRVLVLPTEPYVLLPVLALLAVGCGVRRHWTGLALTVLAPAIAVLLSSWVLKPWFGRFYDDHLAYPSGHTVSLVTTLTVVVLLVRAARTALLVAGIGVLLTVGAGIGMIGLHYHYATDVAGGAGLSVAVVPLIAAVLTTGARAWRRPSPAPSAGSPPAGTSSGTRPGASPR